MTLNADTVKDEKSDLDIEGLRGSMSPFIMGEMPELPANIVEYCRYYDIYFEEEVPVQQYLGYLDVLTFRVAVHYFAHKSPKATVLVMHGYYDHVGLYRHMIRYLLQQGYSVVSYDLPGHGLSSGEPAAIKSFAHYQSVLQACLRQIKGKTPSPLFAVAQSTGAAVLTDYYLSFRHDQENGAFASVVMLAPLIRPKGWKRAKLMHAVLRPFFKTWKRAHRDNTSNMPFLKFLRERDPLQAKSLSVDWVTSLKRWIPRVEKAKPVDMPLTIIQGENDGTVDWRHNVYTLNRKFNKPAVYYIADAEHHLVNESEQLREKMFPIVGRTFEAALKNLNSKN